jgi:hypothetical protein
LKFFENWVGKLSIPYLGFAELIESSLGDNGLFFAQKERQPKFIYSLAVFVVSELAQTEIKN